jgi:transposase
MTVITMSRNELTRLRVLIDVGDGRLSVEDATGLIGVGRRQIYRLLGAFRARPRGSDFAKAWPAQQPGSWCSVSRDRAGDRA